MTEASIGLPKKVKTLLVGMTALAVVNTAKGLGQTQTSEAMGATKPGETLPAEITRTVSELPPPSFVDVLTRGNSGLKEAAKDKVDKQEGYIRSLIHNPWGRETKNLAVVREYWDKIAKYIRLHGVPAGVAGGVALIENHGGTGIVSEKGAVGIFQLMPRTAKDLGLVITIENGKVTRDDRFNPEENIRGGTLLFGKLYERFGDWGFALLAFSMGSKAVAELVFDLAKERGTTLTVNPTVKGESLTDEDFKVFAGYIRKTNLSIHELIIHYWDGLDEESRTYVYKVAAATQKLEQLGVIKPERIIIPLVQPSYQPTQPKGIVV